ncbi:hypothetical protein ACFW9O_35915 [Streptomyces sp. NPDC059499]|uniref:TRADD-N-associated membrane domain-containing protein n=1 Tax=Streptomyces sp. NPDC059499 TaxID=3346852 RepID=UPI0036D1A0B3
MDNALLWMIVLGFAGLVAMFLVFRTRQQFNAEVEKERLHVYRALGVPPHVGEIPDKQAERKDVGSEDDGSQFVAVLLSYYVYGLRQAKSSFGTAQRFAGLGVLILFFGIGMAIWRAETTGDLYLAMVTSASGTVTMLVGHLFHRRADRSLEHMVHQTDKLRDDQRHDANTALSVELINQITDPEVQARLQAALVLKLSGAELPDLTTGAQAAEPRQATATNLVQ